MIKLGDIVPLSVQISDGNSKLDIMVKVLDPATKLLFEGPLTHVLGGFYETKQFVMPEVDYVFALYSVENNKEYASSSEIFYRSEVEEISRALLDEQAAKYDNYYQGMIVQEEKDDFLEGYISGTVEA
jgi:hypothetical protein